MKVAILGNMNNNSSNLIRYLLDRGLDCELLFFENEADYFTPESDNIIPQDYPTKTLTWGSYKKLYLPGYRKQVNRDIAPYDFLIGSRLSPAYLSKYTDRHLDLFMPTGGDIWTVPVFVDLQPKNLAKYLLFSKIQRKGIEDSSCLFFDQTNKETESKISPVISNLPRLSFPLPLLYHPDYEGDALDLRMKDAAYLKQFQNIRDQADIFLVHHVKHLWKKDSVKKFDILQEKGNDKIFYALKKFKQKRPDVRIKILMTEYGLDVQASKELARQLNVDDCICWFPLLPRKELMMAINISDGVIGEIARSWFSYGTILEAMVMNKPVLHNRDDRFFSERVLYPMLNTFDEQSLYDAFLRFCDDAKSVENIGIESGRWYRECAIDSALSGITSLINNRKDPS